MASKLPVTNDLGFYEIRFESIGGLGANLAGAIMSEAVVLGMGLNGANFSSYGSEKRGTPVKSYLRFCDSNKEVRISDPILSPHVVAVFHEALIYGGGDVVSGLLPGGTAVISTAKSPQQMAEILGVTSATVAVVDALRISIEENTRLNSVMLGAVTRVSGFISPDAVKKVLSHVLGERYKDLVQANLKSFDRGYQEVRSVTVSGDGKAAAKSSGARPNPLGYANAPIGGLLPNPGNSIARNWSVARQGFVPQFVREKCTDCGLCDIACPDMCFVWREGIDKRGRPAMVLEGVDYRYCKGCLKCVEACPSEALLKLEEKEGYADQHRAPLFAGVLGK